MRAFENIFLFFVRDYRNLLKRCPQNCIWVTSEMRSSHLGTLEIHLGIAFESPSSELRLRQLGITFESPRNYVWMTLMAKLVSFTWTLVTYRVHPVNCLITVVILHGPDHEHACFWIYIPVFHHRLSKLTEEMTSELPLSHLGNAFCHLGNAFESPRNHVWVTLNVELIAITWPLAIYRVYLVNGLISEVIPHGPEHACVWIYIPVFYHRLSKLTDEMPSELHLSLLVIAFESPRNCLWVT